MDNIMNKLSWDSDDTHNHSDQEEKDSKERKMKSLLIQTMFSKSIERHGSEQQESTESTPLTASHNGNNSNSSTSKKWSKLAAKVKSGEMLLSRGDDPNQPNTINNNNDTTTEEEGLSKHEKTQKYQEEIRGRVEFSLYHCLAAIVLYLVLSVVAYSFVFESWTVIDSMYFGVVTFTTIGYGDLYPTTTAGRLFTAFFALSGVTCLGIALGILGSNLIEAEQKAVEQASKISQKNAISLFDDDDHDNNNNNETEETATTKTMGEKDPFRVNANMKEEGNQQHDMSAPAPEPEPEPVPAPAAGAAALPAMSTESILIVGLLSVFVVVLIYDPSMTVAGKAWENLPAGLYFSIITSSTVGYGDFAPTTQWGRLAFVFFVPIGVGAVGHWLSIIAGTIVESRQSQFRKSLLQQELTAEDIEVMDDDGDGNVTRAEFLEFMLVAMNHVPEDVLHELKYLFHKLDSDGSGTLCKEDLVNVAKRKLRCPERKLELHKYKQELLQKAATAKKKQRQQQRQATLPMKKRATSIFAGGFNLRSMFGGKELEELQELDSDEFH